MPKGFSMYSVVSLSGFNGEAANARLQEVQIKKRKEYLPKSIKIDVLKSVNLLNSCLGRC
jgi:hypothetical protein